RLRAHPARDQRLPAHPRHRRARHLERRSAQREPRLGLRRRRRPALQLLGARAPRRQPGGEPRPAELKGVVQPVFLALALAVLAQTSTPCWSQNDDGRRFRTCFDPGRGVELYAGGSARSLMGGLDLGLSLRLRGERDSKSKAGTSWLLAHHLLLAE